MSIYTIAVLIFAVVAIGWGLIVFDPTTETWLRIRREKFPREFDRMGQWRPDRGQCIRETTR